MNLNISINVNLFMVHSQWVRLIVSQYLWQLKLGILNINLFTNDILINQTDTSWLLFHNFIIKLNQVWNIWPIFRSSKKNNAEIIYRCINISNRNYPHNSHWTNWFHFWFYFATVYPGTIFNNFNWNIFYAYNKMNRIGRVEFLIYNFYI